LENGSVIRRGPVTMVVATKMRTLSFAIATAFLVGCSNSEPSTGNKSMAYNRASYEDSVRRLQKDYLEPGEIPPMPERMPRYDDEQLGVSFFRTFVGEHDDLSNLTLPRTYFGRSEINDALFCNTDLTESRLCWNDFIDVDFSDAVLARSDLRASTYTRVKFNRADLRGADLRRSLFDHCSFEGARLDGAILTCAQAKLIQLTDAQHQVIAFTDEDGPEPDGG
jgi:BTB/POZ domain-containing protein KCTD9